MEDIFGYFIRFRNKSGVRNLNIIQYRIVSVRIHLLHVTETDLGKLERKIIAIINIIYYTYIFTQNFWDKCTDWLRKKSLKLGPTDHCLYLLLSLYLLFVFLSTGHFWYSIRQAEDGSCHLF